MFAHKVISLQLRGLVLKAIKFYQATLSFDHGLAKIFRPYGLCRFRPTCSEYTYQAVEKYGIIKGLWIGFKRILRCNPFNKGGWDPLV